jgi:4-azaleucine resistance transporter AzlC
VAEAGAHQERRSADSLLYRAELRRGFQAVVPFWLGVAPFAVAFAIAARGAGLSPFEIQAMSMLVFAGAAQMAAVSLLASGAGFIAIVATTLIINLRHIIYALALEQRFPQVTRPSRPWLAFLLIDESFGLTMARRANEERSDAFFLGVSLGMYGAFAVFTGLGILIGGYVHGLERAGLDFIFPLVFISLLMPMLLGQRQIAVATIAGASAIVLLQLIAPGAAIFIAICAGAAVGAWMEGE